MTEERITETTTPSGNTHTTHTVVSDDRSRSGGGAGWVIGLLVLIALVAGIWFLTQTSGAEIAKDNAMTNAANEVGEAAGQVGEAAQNAGEAVEGAAE